MGDRIWVQLPVREIYLSPTNHPGQLSLAILSWVSSMSTGQRAVMLCGWGVQAGMARVWWQVKLCDPLDTVIYIAPISQRVTCVTPDTPQRFRS